MIAVALGILLALVLLSGAIWLEQFMMECFLWRFVKNKAPQYTRDNPPR